MIFFLKANLTVTYKKIYHGNNEEEKLENFLITGQKISLRVIARIKALFRNYASTKKLSRDFIKSDLIFAFLPIIKSSQSIFKDPKDIKRYNVASYFAGKAQNIVHIDLLWEIIEIKLKVLSHPHHYRNQLSW